MPPVLTTDSDARALEPNEDDLEPAPREPHEPHEPYAPREEAEEVTRTVAEEVAAASCRLERRDGRMPDGQAPTLALRAGREADARPSGSRPAGRSPKANIAAASPLTATVSNPPRDDAPERERRACETCGDPFEALVLRCLGARIVARHCVECVALHEADVAERAAARAPKAGPTPEERWARLCPPEFRTVAEGGRTDPAKLAESCPALPQILEWRHGERGLMLRGITGQCKTRAMWRLLRRLFDEGHELACFTAGEFGRAYADAAGRYESLPWFERMAAVPVLFIDDLGKGAWSEAVRAVFFDLVDKRTRQGLPILVTTNDDGNQIAERMRDVNLGYPLARRLRDFCVVMTVEATTE